MVRIELRGNRLMLLAGTMAVIGAFILVVGTCSCMSTRMRVSGVRSEAKCVLELELDESIRVKLADKIENIGRRQ